MDNLDSYGQISNDIEINRARLNALGECYGINDPLILDVSRELDQLILSYYNSIKKEID